MDEKQTILVAEDEAVVRHLISAILHDRGYEVVEAEDGKRAVEILDKPDCPVRAIISDLRMPNVDGVELARYNYEKNNLPFIVCTAVADAKTALGLLKLGVQDYLVKPIDQKLLLAILRTALDRSLYSILEATAGRYEGNVGSLEIPTKKAELYLALDWVRSQVQNVFTRYEKGKFLNFLSEFLLNAYEHGNLGIGEREKSRLLEENIYQAAVEEREKKCRDKITVSISVLRDEVAVNITDEGDGFDYNRYLHMPEDILLERLEMPNGRGIYMSTSYFDSIEYSRNGASVTVTKKMRPTLHDAPVYGGKNIPEGVGK